MYKIGVTLSGGGARGIAHTGVLQALHDNNIEPEIISGCSSGALVGALYAEGFSARQIFSFVEKKSIYNIIKMSMPNRGIMELAYFKQVLIKNIPHNSFEQLKKPLYISVTNLNTGKCEMIHRGKIIDYVIASSSIPLLFKPVQIDNYLYVDGGVINNLPIEPIRDKCKVLIGVNVNPVNYSQQLNGLMQVGLRVLNLNLMVNMESRLKQCDVVIQPATDIYGVFSITKAKELFDEGYKAAENLIPYIRERINELTVNRV